MEDVALHSELVKHKLMKNLKFFKTVDNSEIFHYTVCVRSSIESSLTKAEPIIRQTDINMLKAISHPSFLAT